MTNWTKEELLAYILIWSANADFIEHEAEVDIILSKVDEPVYKKLNREFQQDNDNERLNKITSTLDLLNYSSDGKEEIFQDMKEMFLADGKFNSLERNLELGLKRILD